MATLVLAADTARGRSIAALRRVAARGVGDIACCALVVGSAGAVVGARAVALALDAGRSANSVATVWSIVPLGAHAVVWQYTLALPGNAALRADRRGAA